jgi:hypothetical protein
LDAEHAAAKKVADEKEQAKIKNALKNLPKARQCPNGYAWVQYERLNYEAHNSSLDDKRPG